MRWQVRPELLPELQRRDEAAHSHFLGPESGHDGQCHDEPGAVTVHGGGRGGNYLKSRFLAASGVKKLYDSAYVELYEQMHSSGKALELLEQITSSIPTSDTLDQERTAGGSGRA